MRWRSRIHKFINAFDTRRPDKTLRRRHPAEWDFSYQPCFRIRSIACSCQYLCVPKSIRQKAFTAQNIVAFVFNNHPAG
ncbi:hypothetical protein ACGGYM_003470, partial [Salmonella enterica]